MSAEDGSYRAYMRRRSPAKVRAKLAGWRQISPDGNVDSAPGALDIVMAPVHADAPHRVLVKDAWTGGVLRHASVVRVDDEEEAREAARPALATGQPREGIPVRLDGAGVVLKVEAPGYTAQEVRVGAIADAAPHLTVSLERSPGLRGRFVRNGEPLPHVRVQLCHVGVDVASPVQVLERGEPRSLEVAPVDAEAETGLKDAGKASVLGLDGPPPRWSLYRSHSFRGGRADAEGRFDIVGVDVHGTNRIALMVTVPGELPVLLDGHIVVEEPVDLGTIEVPGPAALTGTFECPWAWDPTEYEVVLTDIDHRVPLDENGRFEFPNIGSGDVHFELERVGAVMFQPPTQSEFIDTPRYHVELAPGETRDLALPLARHGSTALSLDLTLNGEPPMDGVTLVTVPLEDGAPEGQTWLNREDGLLRGRVPASGPSRLLWDASSWEGGVLRIPLPIEPLDLAQGARVLASAELEVSSAGIRIERDHPLCRRMDATLELDGDRGSWTLTRLRVKPIKDERSGSIDHAWAETTSIPAGSYRAVLSRPDGTGPVTFDLEIIAGERAEVVIGG